MLQRIALILLALILILTLAARGSTPTKAITAPAQLDSDVLELGQRVAEWQLNHLHDFDYVRTFRESTADERDWIQAALWIGASRWADKSESEQVVARIEEVAKRNQYQLGRRPFHADDHAIGQAYLWLYQRTGDIATYAPTQETFDKILASRPTNDLFFEPGGNPEYEGSCQDRWCWSDALFMAPRTWLMLSRATGDDKYLEYGDKEFWATTDYLFDQSHGLYYRDSRYFETKGTNGAPVFWSRGNGWVYAGLPLIIESLPHGHASRDRYIQLFKTMSAALINLQRDNGYWPASLKDPDAVKTPETSGTAFITFGLAWGVNNGILDGDETERVVEKGWLAIKNAVREDGKVEWVQQVGKSPDPVEKTDTQLYGVGAVLLAASEMLRWSKN